MSKSIRSMRFSAKDIQNLPTHIRAQLEIPKETGKGVVAKSNNKPQSPPHEVLWALLQDVSGAEREYPGAVPGRRFRLDIAFPTVKVAVEVDGWQFHGKYKDAHHKDRERQNLLVMEGWSVLRFSAGQIFDNPEACAFQVMKVLWGKVQKST